MSIPTRAAAKTNREGNISRSVRTHGRETGLVARTLYDTFFPDLSEEKERIIWLVTNHDLGKASPPFQDKIHRKKWEDEIGHQILSATLLRKFEGATKDEGVIVSVHHGVHQKPENEGIAGSTNGYRLYRDLRLVKNEGGDEWRERQELETTKTETAPLGERIRGNIFLKGRIAGFITLCDHIGSSIQEEYGPWQEDPNEEVIERQITKRLGEIEIAQRVEFLPEVTDFQTLTGLEPRAFQNLKWQGKGIYLIEAPTGSGKTELALYLTLQAILKDDVAGAYIGLPTTLTSNRIFDRLRKTLTGKLSSGKLQLSHGKAWTLDKTLKGLGKEIPQSAFEWMQGSNRSLVERLGVGTIDQVLMGTIHTNHWPLRSLLLHNKLIILDEVHSYDAYTSELTAHAIWNLVHKLDCSVLCLSATLSKEKKETLFRGSLPESKGEFEFTFSGNFVHQETLEIADAIKYPNVMINPVFCETVEPTDSQCLKSLKEAYKWAQQGEKVIWIANSVRDAQDYFRLAKESGCNTKLIHSRYTQGDRIHREEEILREFEKDDEKGMLLIGTQVLEQSLDLNADRLYSEISIIELLIQRAGRLWRKWREFRKTESAILTVLVPRNTEKKSFGRSAKVYQDFFQLLRAKRWVEETPSFNKNVLRRHLEFHTIPTTSLEIDSRGKELERRKRAKEEAGKTAPSLEKTQNRGESLVEEVNPELVEAPENAATRKSFFKTIDLVLCQTSRKLYDGTSLNFQPLENGEFQSRSERIAIEKNSIRIPVHLMNENPEDLGDLYKIGRRKYQWIPGSEAGWGLEYDSEIGAIETSRL